MTGIKNEEIHNSFSKNEIRDFLGKMLQENQMFRDVEFLKNQIKEMQLALKKLEKYESVKMIIESLGWKWFDVSDEIYYDKNTYFPFIGTEKEYNEFIEFVKMMKSKKE